MKKKLRQVLTTSFLTLCLAGTIYANPEEGKEALMPTSPSIHTASPIQTQPGSGNKQDLGGTPEDQKPMADPSSKEPDENRVSKPDETEKGENPKAVEAASSQPTPSEEAKAPGQSRQANPVPAPGSQENPSPANPDPGQGQASDPKGEDKKDKPQVDPKGDKGLSDLQEQIDKANAAKDTKTEAALQKEYNEKLFKKIEETGSDKYADDTAKRLTDKDQIALYNQIKEKKKELDEKLEKGTLTTKDVNDFNELLGKFTPPRALTGDEKDAVNKLQETPYVPGVTKDEGNLYDTYDKAKKALEAALDPSKDPLKKEDLDKLVQAFKDAEKALIEGIRSGKVTPNYAKGDPEIYIYPLDSNGKANKEPLKNKETYYIPDDTGLDLLFQVNKNDQPKEFTFTIKNLEKVGNPTLPKVEKDNLKSLVFLNGKPVELKDNGDGTYSFTTTEANQNFGIAQLKFNMPGFRASFHEGFKLTLEGTGGANKVETTFLITKKGYEDYTNLNGKGLQKPGKEKPGEKEDIPEIDGGATEDNIVDQNTKELHDFFVELKKNNAYIDDVLVNSANGRSLPLSSVDITITAPKNFNGNFADFIHKSGLNYHDNGNGTYTLKLNLEKFNKKNFSVDEKGNLMYDGQPIENKKLTDAILESTEGKKYLDENGKEHDITTTTVLEGTLGEGANAVTYQVRLDKDHKVQSLWKKNADGSYEKLGDFKEGKVTANGRTYEVRGNDLISYKKENEVYEGNVSNDKEGKADPTVTPTFEGTQVTVKEKGKDKTSYGGTIVEDKIFQKIGKDEYRYLINQTGLKRTDKAWVDGTGKEVTEGTAGARPVEKAVFKEVTKDGKVEYYIVDGLEYKSGLNLIDKFGRLMNNITVEKDGDNYTFTHAIKKDEKGKALKIEAKKEKSGNVCKVTYGDRTITVGQNKETIFVDNTNYIVNDGHTAKVGHYYYDKEKDQFVSIDKKDVIGDKYYQDLKKSEKLERKTIETYDNGNKVITDDKIQRYYGSLDPKEYFEVERRTYVKKGSGAQTYLESADGKDANIIAGFDSQAVVQTLGEGDKAKKVITNETDIFDAVQNAKFAFRYPGFLAGKDIVYSAKAQVKAYYKDPNQNNTEVSIFGEENSKTVTRYFTLKTNDITNPRFFKNKPEEFEKYGIPNYNFFNIFYRDSTDRQRDNLLKPLLKEKEVYDGKTEDEKKKVDEETLNKLKLLETIQKELKNRFEGAQFALNNEGEVVIQDKDEQVIKEEEVNKMRSLLWEIGFTSKKGDLLFPEDRDTSIVVEDYNMDNRLVYDEIIINDTKENWKKAKDKKDPTQAQEAYDAAKKAVEEAEEAYKANNSEANKKALEEAKETLKEKEEALDKATFKGTDQYFFLDQIDNIRFGVSRGYLDGDFIAVGKDFMITRKQIEDALGYNTEAVTDDKTETELTLGPKEPKDKTFTVKLTRDTEKGQIRIKVLKAFYQENKEYSKDDKAKDNKFYSPVQEAYEKQRNDFIEHADKYFKAEAKDSAEATKKAFQESFKKFIIQTYDARSDCFGTLSHLFEERLKKVSTKDANGKDKTPDAIAEELADIRNAMVKAMDTMDLKYLDPSKGDYKFDDMRFNAIRVELKPNMVIGGAMTPQRTKKFGITSVIVPDVDIPYTDEFGKPMTNKDMYLNKFIKEVVNDEKFTKTIDGFDKDNWNTKEESYVKVMEEAYRRLNEKYESKIVPLVTASGEKEKFAWNKYTIKKGNELESGDLSIDGKPLMDPKGGRINPLYILTEEKDKDGNPVKDKDGNPVKDKDGNPKTKLVKITDLVTDKEVKETLNQKYGNKPIDLIAYYMIKDGYNRPTFKNFAQYKLPKQKQGPGIYGEDNNWKEKICHSGIIGKCIEMSGGDQEPPTPGKNAKGDDGFKANDDITIDYPETDDKPNEEHPEVKKESDKKNIDLSEKDQKINFTIGVSVNQMTKTEKQIYDAETGKTSQIKDGDYSANGHYRYQDGTLIMDILPNIFKLSNGEKIELKVHSDKLISGGSFENEEAVNKWKAGIKYQYVEDLKAYIDGLKDPKQKELLQKAYDKAVKDGEKVQAVIAWLPAFDAPTGTTKHFTFKLNNVLVDKKEFKDYIGKGNGIGEIYTNHAIFKDNGKVYYASTDITIKKDKEGSVDKFLRIYDEKGKIINGKTAKEWFKGNAKLKFGDKFDYKLVYKAETDIEDTSRVGEKLIKVELKDLFEGRKGFKPVLNDFVQVQDKYKDKFIIKYQIGKNQYTQEELEKAGLKLKDVTGIFVKSADGGVNAGEAPEFILPMMVPNLDAKIEDGKVFYIGTDGEKHELGDAKDFFDLKKLLDSGAEMAFENKVEGFNTVTVYLEKERFIKVFKEFLDGHGQKLKNLDNLEAKFDIYQIIEENGVKKRVKVGQLTANKANDFTDMLDHLPIFKKTTTIDEKGNVKVEEVKYDYELQEVPMAGFEGKVWQLKDDEGLGFVWKAENTEKPERPPHNPPEEPKTPPETPPEEPGKPPETPGEKPKYPQDIPGDTPGKPRKPRTPNNLPKTGLVEDLGLVYLSGLALVGLVLLRKKYFLD
ncbi:hypothetical protein [Urinicoccus massiliensis]|uniref:hypothetical protein n=1 Tax=Urinicoccus massiliensis TaxID=1723382 RepID=UPI0009303083|nr:hypothetical protein [Urinicoccus massiliensis]